MGKTKKLEKRNHYKIRTTPNTAFKKHSSTRIHRRQRIHTMFGNLPLLQRGRKGSRCPRPVARSGSSNPCCTQSREENGRRRISRQAHTRSKPRDPEAARCVDMAGTIETTQKTRTENPTCGSSLICPLPQPRLRRTRSRRFAEAAAAPSGLRHAGPHAAVN